MQPRPSTSLMAEAAMASPCTLDTPAHSFHLLLIASSPRSNDAGLIRRRIDCDLSYGSDVPTTTV